MTMVPSAFGLNLRGRTAEQVMDELPLWMQERMKKYWGMEDEQYPTSQAFQEKYGQYLLDQMDNPFGYGTPDDIMGYGGQFLPGNLQEYDDAKASTQYLNEVANRIPGAADVMGKYSSVLDQWGGGIGDDYDRETGDIRDTFNRMAGRGESYGRDIVSNIGDSWGAAEGISADEFGKSRGEVGSTFDQLGKTGQEIFDSSYADLNLMKPGSDARSARIQRAFNPALASAHMRIRKAGIDPNSPEASAMLQRVESDRAFAADDALAEDTDRYIGRKHSLDMTKLQRGDSLGLNRMNQLLALAGKEGDVGRNLALSKGATFRDELARQLAEQQGIDAGRLDANTSAGRFRAGRSDALMNKRANAPLIERDISERDYGIQTDLQNRARKDYADFFNRNMAQAGLGMNYTMNNVNRRDRVAGAMGQHSQNIFNRGLALGQQGLNYGRGAMEGAEGTYERNAPRAGWGTRLIAGAAGAGLDALTGGSSGGFFSKIGGLFRRKPSMGNV